MKIPKFVAIPVAVFVLARTLLVFSKMPNRRIVGLDRTDARGRE